MISTVSNDTSEHWKAIDRAIESDDFPPNPGHRCSWCSFKPICPAFADMCEPVQVRKAGGGPRS